MTIKCNVGAWTGSWERKSVLVYSLDKNIVPIAISWFLVIVQLSCKT